MKNNKGKKTLADIGIAGKAEIKGLSRTDLIVLQVMIGASIDLLITPNLLQFIAAFREALNVSAEDVLESVENVKVQLSDAIHGRDWCADKNCALKNHIQKHDEKKCDDEEGNQ